ncbi:MAG: hypothetical protein GX285_06760 [Clostridiales bacterium]|nr:hypothetical protein [Clostridiales bacterium]
MRIKFYLLTLLLITLLTTGWIFNTGTKQETIPSTSQENTSPIDDVTLDTFIRVYATQILDIDNYTVTADNRESIRSLLISMGDFNIELLKEAVFEGNPENIYEAISTFSENNFMWEEKILLKQYLTN